MSDAHTWLIRLGILRDPQAPTASLPWVVLEIFGVGLVVNGIGSRSVLMGVIGAVILIGSLIGGARSTSRHKGDRSSNRRR